MSLSLARKLVSGAFQLTLSNGLVRVFGVVTMPILTRLLSPQAYGAASLAGTVISLMSVFALAGIDMSYARAYHSAQPPSGAAVEAYCWRLSLLAALAAAIVGALAWWFLSSDAAERDLTLTILVALGIGFSVAQTMAQTRARLAGRYFAMSLSIVGSGFAVVAASMAIAAFWRQDALALVIPLVLGYALSVVFLGVPTFGSFVRPSGLSSGAGLGLIKIGLAGVVTAPLYWLLSSSDRWFLQHFHGDTAVGIYSIGYSVGIVGMMINNAVTAVWLPEAAREFEQDPRRAQNTLGLLMTRLIAAMAIIWLAVAAAGGDLVRWMANERFHGAAACVPYVAGGVFFYGVLHLANTGLLLVKQLKWAALWWLVGGALCLLVLGAGTGVGNGANQFSRR
ncbi:MAG: lipopolysaccharide biosynthesis protein [Deltaproteobacteria bacterium]|nr:lipopolysaccharide biosynthesis protein [Deltaproteobacteria bacterium]